MTVVRSYDDCTISRDILFSSDFYLAVAVLHVPVNDRLKQSIAYIILVNLFLSHIILLLLPFCHAVSIRMQVSGLKLYAIHPTRQ